MALPCHSLCAGSTYASFKSHANRDTPPFLAAIPLPHSTLPLPPNRRPISKFMLRRTQDGCWLERQPWRQLHRAWPRAHHLQARVSLLFLRSLLPPLCKETPPFEWYMGVRLGTCGFTGGGVAMAAHGCRVPCRLPHWCGCTEPRAGAAPCCTNSALYKFTSGSAYLPGGRSVEQLVTGVE